MIDDGFTFEHEGVSFRPFTIEEKATIRAMHSQRREDVVTDRLDLRGQSNDRKCRVFRMAMDWDQHADLKNLYQSVRLMLLNPLLGIRSCELCKKYWFDEDSGKIVMRGDELILRPRYATLRCEITESDGCLKGHHSNPIELNDRNRKAWQHFLARRHVGLTETERTDPIVQKNWQILGDLVEKHGLSDVHRSVPE